MKHCEAEYIVLDDLSIVRININGVMDIDVLNQIVDKSSKLPKVAGYSRVYDFRNCVVAMNVLELYQFPRMSKHMQSIRSKVMKVALLARNGNEDKIKFYETTAVNVGFNIKVFSDDNEAIKWIVSNRC